VRKRPRMGWLMLMLCAMRWLARRARFIRVTVAGCAEGQLELIIPRGRAGSDSCLHGRRWRAAESAGIVPLAAPRGGRRGGVRLLAGRGDGADAAPGSRRARRVRRGSAPASRRGASRRGAPAAAALGAGRAGVVYGHYLDGRQTALTCALATRLPNRARGSGCLGGYTARRSARRSGGSAHD
jgi:hypothetical protein